MACWPRKNELKYLCKWLLTTQWPHVIFYHIWRRNQSLFYRVNILRCERRYLKMRVEAFVLEDLWEIPHSPPAPQFDYSYKKIDKIRSERIRRLEIWPFIWLRWAYCTYLSYLFLNLPWEVLKGLKMLSFRHLHLSESQHGHNRWFKAKIQLSTSGKNLGLVFSAKEAEFFTLS